MRFQEWYDARLLSHENRLVEQYSYTESYLGSSTRVAVGVPALQVRLPRRRWLRTYSRRVLFALWTGCIASMAWSAPASANSVRSTASDQISQQYQIPITNPVDDHTFASVLLATSAALSTTSPVGRGQAAPKGTMYLSLQMTSNPPQLEYPDPNWGSYFSSMTPLSASAFRYVAVSGRSYSVVRADPIRQANNLGVYGDGLVNAVYYFMVPLSNRGGTVIISPSRTVGMEYQGFVGTDVLVSLDVGGPTRIKLSFPKQLTVITSTPPNRKPPAYSTVASGLNLVATVFAGLLVAFVVMARRRKRNHNGPRPVYFVAPTSARPQSSTEGTIAPSSVSNQPPAESPTTENNVPPTTLRVDVLGPLTISPVFAPSSDPVRAIVAFLAMNNDRLFSLDEIQTSIWPMTANGTDIKKPAMRNYMVNVRKTVGERHLPTASGRAGYQLLDFTTDWSQFQRLCDQAMKSSKDDALALRRQALDLAKGPPFTADTTRYFTWTFTTSVVYKMVEAVTALAHELGTHFVLAGDLGTAEDVLRQGLLTDPACLTLWEGLTDVLLESADQSLLERHWQSASAVLHAVDVAALRTRQQG